ncbi:MBL fold metallo-hydrolase [Edaphobacillus lindanitolerans]|uniref:Glyoxylase, beta-lactamase superfamily II n=1 Tax=Edaphobacillus lindanitolerans TaxID=550447 RepID=A0A1U7PJE5_9BACI|nr:MBL fold metallo-hydrolase [Edaphobacillus lindanitolerans]SIT81336.1 Glyoxylase, beta-lactamase superfamily II [Edaphobacillus lindanitolerans]
MIHTITMPTPFAVGDVNVYLLKGDALTLFDAGTNTPEAWEALLHGLKESGYEPGDIEQVILTHHHPDHAGLVDRFDGARLLGHAYNDPWLRRDEAFFEHHDRFYLDCLKEEGVPEQYLKWVPKMKRPVAFMGSRPLDGQLGEGDAVPGHSGWKVLETPGHARSHLAFFNEETGEMIGGDLVLGKISSNPLIEPPLDPKAGRPKSLLEYNDSLRRVAALPVDVVYPGHGEEVRGIAPLIEHRLGQQKERALKVLGMLEDGPKTIFGLTTRLFPTMYEKELGLTLSETIGQADWLVEEGLAREVRGEDGVLHYEQA